jgi:hypothetical protein
MVKRLYAARCHLLRCHWRCARHWRFVVFIVSYKANYIQLPFAYRLIMKYYFKATAIAAKTGLRPSFLQ